MKKRIISMLLAGMMVLNSAVVYADTDIISDDITYAEELESDSENGVAVQNEGEIAFTDGDSDEVDITEENPEAVSSQGETDENEEIQFAEEADDIFQKMKWQFRTLEQPQPVAHLLQV